MASTWDGHEGLRQLAEKLRNEAPNSVFGYRTRLVEGNIGFLDGPAMGIAHTCMMEQTGISSEMGNRRPDDSLHRYAPHFMSWRPCDSGWDYDLPQ